MCGGICGWTALVCRLAVRLAEVNATAGGLVGGMWRRIRSQMGAGLGASGDGKCERWEGVSPGRRGPDRRPGARTRGPYFTLTVTPQQGQETALAKQTTAVAS